MRVQAVHQVNYSKVRNLKKNNGEPTVNTTENISYKGIKGGVKGGVAGAAAAAALGLLTGGFGFAILPLWTVGGAIGGSAMEDENKSSDEDDKDDKDDKK